LVHFYPAFDDAIGWTTEKRQPVKLSINAKLTIPVKRVRGKMAIPENWFQPSMKYLESGYYNDLFLQDFSLFSVKKGYLLIRYE